MFVSHKNIKKFSLDGEIYDEAIIPRIKEKYISMLAEMMRHKGYVRRYDIDPDFTIVYNKKTFEFKLSIYGVFVGKKRAQCLSGIDKNRMIFIPTQTIKSDEAFLPAA
jgi:hypothetical protein